MKSILLNNDRKVAFDSPEWDQVFARWLTGNIGAEDREIWETRLSLDAELREKFCDWLKALRHELRNEHGGLAKNR